MRTVDVGGAVMQANSQGSDCTMVTGVGKLGRSKVGLGKLGLGKFGFGKVGRRCGKLCRGTTSRSA